MSEPHHPPIQHIIWDWNGTLLDDLGLCLVIINGMLARRDLPPVSHNSYLEVFDFPVQDYYQRVGFDFSQTPFEQLSDEFISAYELGRPTCRLMPGAREILAFLAEQGLSQSILSASKAAYLEKAVVDYGIEGHFSSVHGLADHHAAGKLELARQFMAGCQLDPAQMLLVGDTTHDGEIAAELGVSCLLIPNGHHSRSRLEATACPVIPSLAALQDYLSQGL